MNVITENLLFQVDDEENLVTIFDSILKYTKDDSAIEKKNFTLKHALGQSA